METAIAPNDMTAIVEADRAHPEKQHRPIASGALPLGVAWAMTALLLGGGLAAAGLLLPPGFLVAAVTYLFITLSYSQFFKHVAILDVMFIAAGFLVRAVAGAEAIPVESSPWFLTCTAFGALFIALTKRYAELRLLTEGAGGHRKILDEYSEPLLMLWIGISTACTLISYALYTFEADNPRELMLTIPVVIYGVFRYLLLVHEHGHGGAPEKTLLADRPLQICLLLFVVVAMVAMRFGSS